MRSDRPLTCQIGDASEWVDLSFIDSYQDEVSARIVDEKEIPSSWSILPKSLLLKLSGDLPSLQKKLNEPSITTIQSQTLSCQNLPSFVETTEKFLTGRVPPSRLSALTQMEEGIWIGRSVMLHPDCTITAPVYIGPNTRIYSKSSIGPNVYIEGDAIISQGATIKDSCVLRNSCIGEGLELLECVVDRHHLFKTNLKTLISINDERLLSDLGNMTAGRKAKQLLERAIALGVLTLTSPLLFYLCLRHGLTKKSAVSLSNSAISSHWKEIEWISLNMPEKARSNLHRFIELLNVLRGHAHFIGITPRNREELASLPDDWLQQIVHSKLGVITPQEALGIPLTKNAGSLAAECYYTAHMGLRHDLSLFCQFLQKQISDG